MFVAYGMVGGLGAAIVTDYIQGVLTVLFSVMLLPWTLSAVGGSWSKTGANSDWFKHFNAINVQTLPFQASNCGLDVDWGDEFQKKFAGTPLKNIAIQAYGQTFKGI